MFIRTGPNDYQMAVVISDPHYEKAYVGCIAIQSILDLQSTDKQLTCDPSVDFRNGYDAGLVDIDEPTRRRLIRWTDAGMIITLYTTASGKFRFGRVNPKKFGLTMEQQFWLNAWRDSVDYETARRKLYEKTAAEETAPTAKPEPRPCKPKMKRKDRRRAERRRRLVTESECNYAHTHTM